MARRKEKVQQMAGFFDFLNPRKKGSIFDAFDKTEKSEEPEKPLHALPAPKSNLPSARGQQSLAPLKKRESIRERLLSILDMGPAQEIVEKQEIKPSQEIVEKGSPWEAMFQPSVEDRPIFQAEPVIETSAKYKFITTGVQRIPYGEQEWRFPNLDEMVDHLSEKVDFERVFDDLAENRATGTYQDMLAEAAFRGIPLYTPISIIDDKNFFTDFADFYGIPWSVVESFSTPEEFHSKILGPMSLILTEAFEVVKPDGLPGFFTVDYNAEDGHYWLYYVEPWLGRLPGP